MVFVCDRFLQWNLNLGVASQSCEKTERKQSHAWTELPRSILYWLQHHSYPGCHHLYSPGPTGECFPSKWCLTYWIGIDHNRVKKYSQHCLFFILFVIAQQSCLVLTLCHKLLVHPTFCLLFFLCGNETASKVQWGHCYRTTCNSVCVCVFFASSSLLRTHCGPSSEHCRWTSPGWRLTWLSGTHTHTNTQTHTHKINTAEWLNQTNDGLFSFVKIRSSTEYLNTRIRLCWYWTIQI